MRLLPICTWLWRNEITFVGVYVTWAVSWTVPYCPCNRRVYQYLHNTPSSMITRRCRRRRRPCTNKHKFPQHHKWPPSRTRWNAGYTTPKNIAILDVEDAEALVLSTIDFHAVRINVLMIEIRNRFLPGQQVQSPTTGPGEDGSGRVTPLRGCDPSFRQNDESIYHFCILQDDERETDGSNSQKKKKNNPVGRSIVEQAGIERGMDMDMEKRYLATCLRIVAG